jgi:hypothetical protein
MKAKDIFKLLAGLALVAAVAWTAFLLIRTEGDLTQKYAHPITRPGAHW